MAKFTTRVELHHSATYQDYVVLHSAMAREGFSRTITGRDGQTYHLPPAEYNVDEQVTSKQVLAAAKRAAEKTNKDYSVLISRAVYRTWYHLEKVS